MKPIERIAGILLLYVIVNFIYLKFHTEKLEDGFTSKYEAKNEMVNNLKEGKWIEYKDSSWNAVSADSAVYYSLNVYKSGVKFGIQRDYNLEGNIQSEFSFSANGKRNGIAKWFYESGKLQKELPYNDDKENGESMVCYESGEVKEKVTYADGLETGMLTSFYESGKKLTEVPYSNGKMDGPYTQYYENGKTKQECTYKDGKAIGTAKFYYESGQLQEEDKYADDKLEGEVKLYFESGKLNEVSNYKEGKLDGNYIAYYGSGQKKTEGKYKADTQVGIWKEWDDKGNLLTQKSFDRSGNAGEENSVEEVPAEETTD